MVPVLANPKPAKSDDRACWYRFYAMFSEKFTEEVLSIAGLPKGAVALDPWLGAGTTTAVAARTGLRALGVDINPAMIVVAQGRCIDRGAATEAIERIEVASGHLIATLLP